MSGPVPVVRVVFPERAFFAFDSAEPLPASLPILDVIAEDMKRDVPDAAMTVLGHTDGIGTDAYNIDLSRRRAAAVISALVARGVDPGQLSAVAIGKRQPIAPNDTPDGRSLNRRVEFLISPGISANLAAVQQRVVPSAFFQIRAPDAVTVRQPLAAADPRRPGDPSRASLYDDVVPAPQGSGPSGARLPYGTDPRPLVPEEVLPRLPSVAEVYAPAPVADARGPDALRPLGGLPLSPVAPAPIAQGPVGALQPRSERVALAPTMPVAPVRLIPPDEVVPRAIDPDDTDHS